MAVVADANVLVAAANASDSLHSRAARAIAEAAKPIYIPEYAAVEIVTVLSRTIGKDIADSFLRQLIAENDDFEFLASSPALFAAAAVCLYLIGRLVFSQRAGLLASFFFSIFPISIYSINMITDEHLFVPLWFFCLYI